MYHLVVQLDFYRLLINLFIDILFTRLRFTHHKSGYLEFKVFMKKNFTQQKC